MNTILSLHWFSDEASTVSHWQHRALSLSASDPAGSDIGAIVTMTECESNIESESECESNIESRPPAAAAGFGRRLLAGPV